MIKKTAKFFAIFAAVAYIGFCLAVYYFPQYFFYNPSTEKSLLSNAVAKGFPAEEVRYKSSDGTELYGWYVKPTRKDKVVVYFHGNSHNIEAFYHKLIPLTDSGYGVFIGEYRGFGGINGKINEKNLGEDAIAAVQYLYSQGWKNKDIILYGMSLGSYTSIHTAHTLGKDDPFASLILEVPFDSILNVAKDRVWPLFPFSMIIKDKYDNTKKLSEIKLPVLFMVTQNDKVVPIQRAKELSKAIVSKYPMVNIRKSLKDNPSTVRSISCITNDAEKPVMINYNDNTATHSNLYEHKNWEDILVWLACHENWLENNEKIK